MLSSFRTGFHWGLEHLADSAGSICWFSDCCVLAVYSLEPEKYEKCLSQAFVVLNYWCCTACSCVELWIGGMFGVLTTESVFIALPKEKIRKLVLSSYLRMWSVPVGHWYFCKDTNLSKHKACAVLFLNCSEKCYEEIFQTIGFLTCCNFSVMFTPSSINFLFWFLCLLQFLTFLWLHVFLVRKLRNRSSHETVLFKFLNVAWI